MISTLRRYTNFKDLTIQEFIQQILPHLEKPIFQRPMYWEIRYNKKNKKIPNMRDYIKFICQHSAAVARMHVGVLELIGAPTKYSLIDGNNRLNAILIFLEQPYLLFPDYYDDVFEIIDKYFPIGDAYPEINKVNNNLLKDFLKEMDYMKLRYWTDPKSGFGNHLHDSVLRTIGSDMYEINNVIIELKGKWGDGTHGSPINIYTEVKLSFAMYHHYTPNELQETFKTINKYESTLNQRDALAAQLCFTTVSIDEELKNSLMIYALKYMREKHNENETAIRKEVTNTDNLSAFDCLVSLNDLVADRYGLITPYKDFCENNKKNKDAMPIVFNLFENEYCSDGGIDESKFTPENIEKFSKFVIDSCKLLKETLDEMYPPRIIESVFGETNYNFGRKLDKTKLSITLTLIFEELKRIKDNRSIKDALKRVLFYHSFKAQFRKKCKDEVMISKYDRFDLLGNGARKGHYTAFLKRAVEKELTCEARLITRTLFNELLNNINKHNINPYKYVDKPGKRKNKTYFDLVMMTNLIKTKMPMSYIDRVDYEVDHMIPHSLRWGKAHGEDYGNPGELDLCRLGNLVPVLKKLNQERKNKDITIYYSTVFKDFTRFLQPLIYTSDDYNKIVETKKSGSNMIVKIKNGTSIDKYNEQCSINERYYINTFLKKMYEDEESSDAVAISV